VNKKCTAKPSEDESAPQYKKKKHDMNIGLLKRDVRVMAPDD
jgi:hypothetical protein